MKLTPAQWLLLGRLYKEHLHVAGRGVPVIYSYAPGQALVRLGLATRQTGKRFRRVSLHITDAGLTAWRDHEQAHRDETQRFLDDARGRRR